MEYGKTRAYRGKVGEITMAVPNEGTGMSFAFQIQRDLPLPPEDPIQDPTPIVYIRFAQENALHLAGFVCFASGFEWTVEVVVRDNNSGWVLAVKRV